MKSLAVVAMIAATPYLALAGEKHDHVHEKGRPATLTGEVLDLACFMQHPDSGQGQQHATCAKECINKGLPAGFKVGDKVYLLLAEGHAHVASLVANLAGRQATLTGKVLERNQLSVLVVTSVASAPPK